MKNEIMSTIYDTIMENVGMTEHHKSFLEVFDTCLKDYYVDEEEGVIGLVMGNNQKTTRYEISIKEV